MQLTIPYPIRTHAHRCNLSPCLCSLHIRGPRCGFSLDLPECGRRPPLTIVIFSSFKVQNFSILCISTCFYVGLHTEYHVAQFHLRMLLRKQQPFLVVVNLSCTWRNNFLNSTNIVNPINHLISYLCNSAEAKPPHLHLVVELSPVLGLLSPIFCCWFAAGMNCILG